GNGGATSNAVQPAFQQSPGMVARHGDTAPAMLLQVRLHLLPYGRVDNGGMRAVVDFVLMFDLADVEDIGQQLVQAWLGERSPAPRSAFAAYPTLVDPATPLQFLDHRSQRLVLQIQLEDCP